MSSGHKKPYRKLEPRARRLSARWFGLPAASQIELLWMERWRVPVGGWEWRVVTQIDRAYRVVTWEIPNLTGLACRWPRRHELSTSGTGEAGQG